MGGNRRGQHSTRRAHGLATRGPCARRVHARWTAATELALWCYRVGESRCVRESASVRDRGPALLLLRCFACLLCAAVSHRPRSLILPSAPLRPARPHHAATLDQREPSSRDAAAAAAVAHAVEHAAVRIGQHSRFQLDSSHCSVRCCFSSCDRFCTCSRSHCGRDCLSRPSIQAIAPRTLIVARIAAPACRGGGGSRLAASLRSRVSRDIASGFFQSGDPTVVERIRSTSASAWLSQLWIATSCRSRSGLAASSSAASRESERDVGSERQEASAQRRRGRSVRDAHRTTGRSRSLAECSSRWRRIRGWSVLASSSVACSIQCRQSALTFCCILVSRSEANSQPLRCFLFRTGSRASWVCSTRCI